MYYNLTTNAAVYIHMMCIYIWPIITLVLVSGLRVDSKHQFDLIDGLRVYNNSYRGLSVVEGIHHLSPAILLTGIFFLLLLLQVYMCNSVCCKTYTKVFLFQLFNLACFYCMQPLYVTLVLMWVASYMYMQG